MTSCSSLAAVKATFYANLVDYRRGLILVHAFSYPTSRTVLQLFHSWLALLRLGTCSQWSQLFFPLLQYSYPGFQRANFETVTSNIFFALLIVTLRAFTPVPLYLFNIFYFISGLFITSVIVSYLYAIARKFLTYIRSKSYLRGRSMDQKRRGNSSHRKKKKLITNINLSVLLMW